MKNIKSTFTQLLLVSAIILLFGCEKGSSTEKQLIDETSTPGKVVGILPANGEPCADYTEVTNEDSKVLVLFNWNAAQFAQSYILVVSESSNEVFKNSFTTLNAEVQLDKGKTYTWYMISINKDKETSGDTFSFTTPGIPVGNFAPYAAEITVEFDNDTFEMQVSWLGNDEDGDSLKYDVKVLESETVLIEYSDLELTSIDPIVFSPGTTYEIEVTSMDSNGNSSKSILNIDSPN